MTSPGSWKLEGFPERLADVRSDLPDEVHKAYAVWVETRRVDPHRGAQRLQADDARYTAIVPNAVFADRSGGWRLACDYDVFEPELSRDGRVVFVELGLVPGEVLTE